MFFQRKDKPKVEEFERDPSGRRKAIFDRVATGKKAAATNKRRYGKNYYEVIGASGGRAEYTGKKGFAAHPDLAKEVGKIGGAVSKRRRDER